MPNGERAIISERDLHHILLEMRIVRKPERIVRLLSNVVELRTAHSGRMMGLSEWVEEGAPVLGFVILDDDSHVRSMHLHDAKGLRKKSRQGERLWNRHE